MKPPVPQSQPAQPAPTAVRAPSAGALAPALALALAVTVAAHPPLARAQEAAPPTDAEVVAAAEAVTESVARGECRAARRAIIALTASLPTLDGRGDEALAAYATASHAVLGCRLAAAPPEFGGVTMGPGAAPSSVTGIAYGAADASARFGGVCIGFVAETPGHVVELPAPGRLSVEAFSSYQSDIALVVRGPTTTLCNDDFNGLNPAVSDEVPAGRYEIYVSELDPTGYGSPYELVVHGDPLIAPSYGAEPTAGVARVGTDPSGAPYPPVILEGEAHGELSARRFGTYCLGRTPAVPSHRIEVTEYTRVSVEVEAEADLALVIAMPGTAYCNDDFGLFNPAVSEWMRPGSYDVYVGPGAAGGPGGSYSIRFSQDDLYRGAAGSTDAVYGELTLGPAPARIESAGAASGYESASFRFGPACSGQVDTVPSHRLVLPEAGVVAISAYAGSEASDLTMVLTGPAGTFCADDTNGRDPALMERLSAGTYDLYIGEYSFTDAGTPYGLVVARDDAGAALSRPEGVVAVPAEGLERVFWGIAEGWQASGSVPGSDPSCSGWVPFAPTLTFSLEGPSRVEVAARSAFDLVLELRGPIVEGLAPPVRCNDDADGLNPGIVADLEAGTYEVYVGEYERRMAGTAFGGSLRVTPGTGEPLPSAGALPAGEPAHRDRLELGAAERHVTVNLAGRRTPAFDVGSGCVGYVGTAPDLELEVTAAGRYAIRTISAADTTLVVDGPGGPFCNDDYEGFDARVEADLEPGTYRVWVGTFVEGDPSDVSLRYGPATR
jgi:hypothetical protein